MAAWPAATLAVALASLAGCTNRTVTGNGGDSTGGSTTGPGDDGAPDDGGDPGDGTTATDDAPTATGGGGTTDDGWTTGDDWPTGDGGAFLYGLPDAGSPDQCDPWTEDCPDGEKCMPWANDGGNTWNATKCSPVAPDPAQPGEACMVEGNHVSGVDTCALHSMCFDVDEQTNTGVCVPFCTGTPASPTCPQGTACAIANEGVIILCLPTCDPLAQHCVVGDACYPVGSVLVCITDASGSTGAAGDECWNINSCDPGLLCTVADTVPDCQAGACCTEFCDLNAADPNALCSQVDQGTECTPFFEEGTAPPDLEHVGICVLPS